jgi:hypothetical protein
MSGSESRVRWPDGVSLSAPFPLGRIGGTYFRNPGSPTAPRLDADMQSRHAWRRSTYGLPEAGDDFE